MYSYRTIMSVISPNGLA